MYTSFETLLDEYGGLLSRVASSYEANPDIRQELLQEICLAVWQSLENFRGDSQIKTYIMRVAHNKAVSHVAYHAKQLDKQEFCETTHAHINAFNQTEVSNEQAQKIDRLLQQVRKLPLQSRQIVTMSMEGLSYNEIADVCGLKTSNVGVILNRAKSTLMEKLAHE